MNERNNQTPKMIDPERYKLQEVENSAHGERNVVKRVKGVLHGVRDHAISLIRRERREGVPQYVHPRQEMAMREELKKLGILVIPTFRMAKNEDIYGTDLTKDKTNYVRSWSNISFEEQEIAERQAQGEFNVPVESAQEILDQAYDIARRCAQAGILIKNPDALYFVIDKQTRDTEVYAGDYKHFEHLYDHTLELSSKDYGDLLFRNLLECDMAFSAPRINGILNIPLQQIKQTFRPDLAGSGPTVLQ